MDSQVMTNKNISRKESLQLFFDKRSIAMLFLGFSAGLPILMIFSSLSLWLSEAGVKRSAVTYFSWAALGYSFKFIWAPLVDRLPLPIISKALGRRKSWLLFSQFAVIMAIILMAFVNPAGDENALTYMALAAIMLGFSSATQDVVIDAFRIESAESDMQAILSATYIAGYRIGMLVSGAGALFIASWLGSSKGNYYYPAWKYTYLIMAGFMLIGVVTTLLRPEPKTEGKSYTHSTRDYAQFFFLFLFVAGCFATVFFLTAELSQSLTASFKGLLGNRPLAEFIVGSSRLLIAILTAGLIAFGIGKSGFINTEMLKEGYIAPVKNFFDRYGVKFSLLLLSLIGLYRISDIVLGVISNVFYLELGYTKIQIASVVKTFGLIMSLIGGFVGGIFTKNFGVLKMLYWGAILSAATNLLFLLLTKIGASMPMLYVVISADNLAAGLASAAFVAFLSGLTDTSFTAVQYAIFSSFMTLIPKVFGGYSGGIVDSLGYSGFFILTTLMGVPVLYIVLKCSKYQKSRNGKSPRLG